MKKTFLAIALCCSPTLVLAAQTPVTQIDKFNSPTTSINTLREATNSRLVIIEGDRQDHVANIATKADKAQAVRYWTDHTDGTTITVGTIIAYNGKLYNTKQNFLKTAGATPDTFTSYFEVASGSGGVTSYTDLTDKPTIPTVSDTAYGVGWNGDTGAASKNALYDKIETITGGSMTYPGAGIPVSTGTSWGTSITPGTGVAPALGFAPNTAGGFLLYSTYASDPLIAWDTATITETVDNPVAGTNKIGVKSGVFQAYDAQLDTWAGVTPGTGVDTALAVNIGEDGGVMRVIDRGTATINTTTLNDASIDANSCATQVVAVASTNVLSTDVPIVTPNAAIDGVTSYGVTTAGALRIDVYPTAGYVNFKVCNPTGAAIVPGEIVLNWMVPR